MSTVKSTELVARSQEMQRAAVEKLKEITGVVPHLEIVREFDPVDQDRYKPTASYSTQIRNHAASVGATTREHVVLPGSAFTATERIRRIQHDKNVTGIMPLYPFGNKDAVKAQLAIRPEQDVDDLLGIKNRAPTARAMVAMGNICLHADDPKYLAKHNLDQLSRLALPDNMSAANIRLGGRGDLTGGPLVNILGSQGIDIADSQIATQHNPSPLKELPDSALVFTATPVAEQIKNHNIPSGSIIIDAGFGVVDGVTYGNTEHTATERDDVLWTPPREGVGPASTTYLMQHLIEAAADKTGIPYEDLGILGPLALRETVDANL
jgi:5,10-methylene-tetrahydrofolate dehydrogenase/methenyl tetrahydrofolate cyclohydrolase